MMNETKSLSERATEALESLRQTVAAAGGEIREDGTIALGAKHRGPWALDQVPVAAIKRASIGLYGAGVHRAGDGVVTLPEGYQPAVAEPGLFELTVPTDARIQLGEWLIEKRGWPPVQAAFNVDLFAAAVKRAYIAEHGCEPEWRSGWVYLSSDLPLVERVYEAEAGAMAERIAFEGGDE